MGTNLKLTSPKSGHQTAIVYQAFDGALASDPIEVTIDVLLPANVGTGRHRVVAK